MNRAEIQEVFRTIDANRDGSIGKNEWINFHRLFLVQFYNCD
jgi:Ca2+-binding EF-hand superfamily protein